MHATNCISVSYSFEIEPLRHLSSRLQRKATIQSLPLSLRLYLCQPLTGAKNCYDKRNYPTTLRNIYVHNTHGKTTREGVRRRTDTYTRIFIETQTRQFEQGLPAINLEIGHGVSFYCRSCEEQECQDHGLRSVCDPRGCLLSLKRFLQPYREVYHYSVRQRRTIPLV